MECVSDVVKGVYLLYPFCVGGKAEQLPGILGSGAEPARQLMSHSGT